MRLYVEFDDQDGQRVRVTPSSLATQDAVRVYLTRPAVKEMDWPEVDACIHLTEFQALALVAGLRQWLFDARDR